MDTLKELYDQWSLQKKEEEYFSKADYEIFKKKGIKRFEKGNIKHRVSCSHSFGIPLI